MSRPLCGPSVTGDTVLYGHRCARCGRVAFPRQPYGCQACGQPGEGEPVDLAATGVVLAATTVHQHHDRPVPFTVVAVRLDGGPVVRAPHVDAAVPGDRVRGRFDPTSEHLRFEAGSGEDSRYRDDPLLR